MSEERRNEHIRRLLWSARNHLEAALARADDLHAAEDSLTPFRSQDPPVRLDPFVRQEIAIHAGVATEHFLKALILSDPKSPRLADGDMHSLLQRAVTVSPDVDLHKTAIKRVGKSRNAAIHDGRGPDRGMAIRNVMATEEFAHHVFRELRRAGHPVLAEFREFDEFKDEEGASRAMHAWQSDVRARITEAVNSFAAKTEGRDVDEVAALLELDREAWLKAADPEALYEDQECPACKSGGFIILRLEEVDLPDGSVAEYAQVSRFYCLACGLDLDYSDLQFAGITDTFSDPNPELLYE
jgi:hypothetical protein